MPEHAWTDAAACILQPINVFVHSDHITCDELVLGTPVFRQQAFRSQPKSQPVTYGEAEGAVHHQLWCRRQFCGCPCCRRSIHTVTATVSPRHSACSCLSWPTVYASSCDSFWSRRLSSHQAITTHPLQDSRLLVVCCVRRKSIPLWPLRAIFCI